MQDLRTCALNTQARYQVYTWASDKDEEDQPWEVVQPEFKDGQEDLAQEYIEEQGGQPLDRGGEEYLSEAEWAEDLLDIANGTPLYLPDHMSMFYPVPSWTEIEAAQWQATYGGALLAVRVGEAYGFVLCAGGMNLSDEVCEAYISAGYLPPVHFAARLAPWMKPSPGLVSVCREALEIAAERASRAVENFDRLGM
jgi:hypothetical protein